MSYKLNPITGQLDLTGFSNPADVALDMGTFPIILKASDGSRWNLTISTDGSLVTTLIPASGGMAFGPPPFLWMPQ